jgi:hypothetical protein
MEKTFALVQGSTVVNTVIADDLYINAIQNDYTAIVDVTEEYPRPSAGTIYNLETKEFTFPQTIIEPEEESTND